MEAQWNVGSYWLLETVPLLRPPRSFLNPIRFVNEGTRQASSRHFCNYFVLYVILICIKDDKEFGLDDKEKEEEGMGPAAIKYGDTYAFLQHAHSGYWLSYKVNYNFFNT